MRVRSHLTPGTVNVLDVYEQEIIREDYNGQRRVYREIKHENIVGAPVPNAETRGAPSFQNKLEVRRFEEAH